MITAQPPKGYSIYAIVQRLAFPRNDSLCIGEPAFHRFTCTVFSIKVLRSAKGISVQGNFQLFLQCKGFLLCYKAGSFPFLPYAAACSQGNTVRPWKLLHFSQHFIQETVIRFRPGGNTMNTEQIVAHKHILRSFRQFIRSNRNSLIESSILFKSFSILMSSG